MTRVPHYLDRLVSRKAQQRPYGTSAVLMYAGDVAPETEKGLLTVAR